MGVRKLSKMNSNVTILNFLTFLAEIRSMFRKMHLFAEQSNLLQSVSTTVIPFKGEPSDYADDGVTLSVALNAELLKPVDCEKKALGAALLLRHTAGFWLAEAEVGWTGEKVGWDPIHSREVKSPSIEQIIEKIPPLIELIKERFTEEVRKLPA